MPMCGELEANSAHDTCVSIMQSTEADQVRHAHDLTLSTHDAMVVVHISLSIAHHGHELKAAQRHREEQPHFIE